MAAETKLAVVEVITMQEGEYTVATASLGGTKGAGTSRKEAKAVSYALEDLAAKLRAAA